MRPLGVFAMARFPSLSWRPLDGRGRVLAAGAAWCFCRLWWFCRPDSLCVGQTVGQWNRNGKLFSSVALRVLLRYHLLAIHTHSFRYIDQWILMLFPKFCCHQILEYFCHSNKKRVHCQSLSVVFIPHCHRTPLVYLMEMLYTQEPYNTWSFVTDFFHLARCLQSYQRLLNNGQNFIPLLSDGFPLCGYEHVICPFINWWICGSFSAFCYYEKCYYKHLYIKHCVNIGFFFLRVDT